MSDPAQSPGTGAPAERLTIPPLQPDEALCEAREWLRLLDAGAIPNRNPPPAPEVVANRDATAALFRRLAGPRMYFGPPFG